MENEIKAVIFDLDGVITDTAEYHFEAWRGLSEEIGVSIDRQFNEQLKGVSRMESLNRILKHGNQSKKYSEEEKVELATKKNHHYRRLISAITPSDILPGILPLLEELKLRNILIGLGSASKNAPEIIQQLKLNDYFNYIVDANKVKQGKPHPETFLVGADHLNVPYKSCVGIEDAKAGVEAIKAASMFAVGVGSGEVLKKADYVVATTEELSFEKIAHAFNRTYQN